MGRFMKFCLPGNLSSQRNTLRSSVLFFACAENWNAENGGADLFYRQKRFGRNPRLFENGAEGSFWHVSGMVWDCSVLICFFIIPDFMTSSGMAVEAESQHFESFDYFPIAEPG